MSTDEHKSADLQIHAHRQQHQKRLTKLFGGTAAVVLILLIVVVVYQILTNSDSAGPEKADIVKPLSLSTTQIEAYRDQFKDALTQYEDKVQPKIDKIRLADWETAQVVALALLKEKGLTAFAQGSFLQAKQDFETLFKQSEALILQWETQTLQHIESAKIAFSNEQIPQAQLHLNKAFTLMPTNLEALALQNRIDAFGEIAILLNNLQVAKIENDLPKQIDLLNDIIQLDPQRSELSQDLAKVKVSYEQQKLAEHLDNAEIALSNMQLGKAQQLVDAAQLIMPTSKGAQSLNSRIAQARSQQSLVSIKASVEQAANQDKWEEVEKLTNNALQRYSSDTLLKNYQVKALQVLAAKKNLAVFIARPERLADDNIRAAATNTIQSAFAPSLLSPSLQLQIEQVAKTVDNYNSPVNITIESDGLTYITVLGVGHVGEHKKKVITLTPGKYVLQGKREGFRNKRLEFTVKGNSPLFLSLICDEKI